MTSTTRATRRHPATGAYARALLDVGLAKNEAVEYGEELRALAEEVFSDGALRVFFESPKIPRNEKKQVLDRVLADKVSASILNLVKILIDRDRQELLGQVADAFDELLDQHRGRVHVKITSATPMPLELQQTLVGAISAKLGREVSASTEHDESLIGGVTLQIGDTVVDGSVRTRLSIVGDAMGETRVGSEVFDEG